MNSSTEDPPETPLDDDTQDQRQTDAGPERELDVESEGSNVTLRDPAMSAVQSPHISPMSSRPGTPLTTRSSTPVNIADITPTEEDAQTRSHAPQRQGKRKASEGNVEFQKLAILKQISGAFKPPDDEDTFAKQVASELRQVKDPAIKVRVKRNIMELLYDAQESEHARGLMSSMSSYASGGPATPQHRLHEPMYGLSTPMPVPHSSYMPLQGYARTPTHTQTQSFMGMLSEEQNS